MKINGAINVVRSNSGEWAEAFGTRGFVGADFDIGVDVARFSREELTRIIAGHGDKGPISNGLRAGMLGWLAHGIRIGDVVVSPTPDGRVRAGRVTGDYAYVANEKPRHRRPVRWLGLVTPSRPITSWQAVFAINPGSSLYGPLSNDLAQVPEADIAADVSIVGLEERRVRALEILASAATEIAELLRPEARAAAVGVR